MTWMAFLWDHPPMFIDGADGARFHDVDGNEYVDFSLGITAASGGHAHPAIVEAACARIAHGFNFTLPTEDSVVASEELARRFGLPYWQYSLSSTQANTDVIRIARILTGKERVLMFEGKYQGHLAELLAVEGDGGPVPEYAGISEHDIARSVIVDWNDLDAVARVLAGGDIAIAIAEPLLTNSGLVLPEAGFHDGLRRLTREAGVLLLIDETQTAPMGYGGMTRSYGLEPDFLVLGKSIAGGIPIGAYGMRQAACDLLAADHAYEVTGEAVDEPATGGTLWGNALSMAALRAALEHLWTPATHERMEGLAGKLADGIRATFERHGRAWDVYHVGNRAGYRFCARQPRNNREAGAFDLPAVRHLQRVYLANRGVWDFGWWGGPAVSAQTSASDVEAYLGAFGEFADEVLK